MGGKGGSSAPPELQRNIDQSGQLEALLGLFEGMMGGMMAQNASLMESMAQMANKPSIPELPMIFEEPEIDWTEENQKLQAKMKADQELADKQKRGRASTIHSSPLLDEEDAQTTRSLLGS